MADEVDVAAEKIARLAAEAVGSNPPGEFRIPPIAAQIAEMEGRPQAGPLKRILEGPAMQSLVRRYDAADAAAIAAQSQYHRSARTIGVMVAVAIALGASAIIYPDQWLGMKDASREAMAKLLMYAVLAVSLILVWRLKRNRTYERWQEERGEAEHLRHAMFDEVIAANGAQQTSDELPLLPLKLEYFRRYQLDLQKTYHSVMRDRHMTTAKRAGFLIWPCTIATVIFFLALLGELLSALAEQGPLPDFVPGFVYTGLAWMQSISSRLIDLHTLYLGVFLALLYAGAYMFATVKRSVRNAARHENAKANFAYLTKNGLDAARRAAAASPPDEAATLRFVHKVQSLMSNELADWVRLMKLDKGEDDDGKAAA